MYQVELLRLDPTLLGSLPSTAAPVLRNIHACFVAGRLLRYATLWPHPDPNSTPEPDPNSNPDPTPTPNPNPRPAARVRARGPPSSPPPSSTRRARAASGETSADEIRAYRAFDPFHGRV